MIKKCLSLVSLVLLGLQFQSCKQPDEGKGSKIQLTDKYSAQTIVHDTVPVHDTLFKYNLDTSALNLKHLKLLCIDDKNQTELEVGKIYSTIAVPFKDENGDSCYYVDGIGVKRKNRFVALLHDLKNK